jgi:hypothetical protein
MSDFIFDSAVFLYLPQCSALEINVCGCDVGLCNKIGHFHISSDLPVFVKVTCSKEYFGGYVAFWCNVRPLLKVDEFVFDLFGDHERHFVVGILYEVRMCLKD